MVDCKPTVSVVMSVYNGERHLSEAIQSVLEQTYADFEFIIVNDGSTDGTKEILASFTDPRIRIVEQPNRGLAVGLNAGIALARGRFVARQDANDIWLPLKLARQVSVLEANPAIDVVACLSEVMDDEKGEGPLLHRTASSDPRVDAPFPHTAAVIRRASLLAVGGYDPRLRYGQDRHLWLRLYNGRNFYVVPEVLLVWRQTRGQDIVKLLLYAEYAALVQCLAGTPLDQQEAIIVEAMERIARRRDEIEQQVRCGQVDASTCLDHEYHWNWANRYLKGGQPRRARHHFRQLRFRELPLLGKVKYLSAFLPASAVVPLMRWGLRTARLLTTRGAKCRAANLCASLILCSQIRWQAATDSERLDFLPDEGIDELWI